jgi:tetratricopeptide (TPR) repeat protein
MNLRSIWLCMTLGGFAAAAVWSVRLGSADYWFQQQTAPATRKAIALTPGQTDYYLRLALLADANDRTATELLQHAVTLNSSDSRLWDELGLRYERQGNRAEATRCLLRAAEVDRQYLPRWTLANYYFRGNEPDRFWFWAKEAAQMAPGDPAPLFRLCGRVTEDGALIDRLNIRRPEVRAAYLAYLLEQRRLDLIQPAIRHLLRAALPADVPLLLTACDWLLDGKQETAALEIWNALVDRHRIPFTRLDPARGAVLTNGTLEVPPTSRGFDWRLPAVEGVSASSDEGGGLRLTFSGNQPERSELLSQMVALQNATGYELKFEYRTQRIASGSGLAWRIANQDQVLAEADSLSSEEWRSGRLFFTTPAACRLAQLSLTYRRLPGTTRIEGYVALRNVELRPATALP